MKRNLSLLFAIAIMSTIIIMLMPLAANAAVVDSGTCGAEGANVTWTLDDNGTLTISGEGNMEDYHFYYYEK